MTLAGIRLRTLLLAMLPVTLVAALLSAIVVATRIGELEDDHRERAHATVRQVAAAAELGLFAGNDAALQALATAVARQADVRAVELLRRDGAVAARAGNPRPGASRLPAGPDMPHEEADADVRRVVQVVTAADLPLEDWITEGAGRRDHGAVLGYAAVELSRDSIKAAERRLWLAGILVTLAGMLVGAFLALRTERAQERLERRIAEATAELRAKKDEAELATRAKSRFLAAASHDLRQPMHALGLFVARLEQLPHQPETRRLIGNVEVSVRALQDLLDALLDISRLDSGTEKARIEPVEVGALFERLEREFASAAEEKGLALRVRPCPLWVASDARLLYRALLNLVSNAVRYTARGGVLVSGRRRGASALLEVYDTGVGIPAHLRDEVFLEFVQLHNPERDRTRGLGLGLTIVKRTAELLGHRLTLASTPGRGSCFRLELPLAQPPAAAAEPPPLAVPDLSGVALLVVDDDALVRAALAELLRSWGCRVHPAASAADALAAAHTMGAPDLIACDYRLPDGEDAIGLVGRLRAAFKAPVPAFLMSGDTDPEVLRAAEASGLALLHKPVRPARLRALIYRLVRRAP